MALHGRRSRLQQSEFVAPGTAAYAERQTAVCIPVFLAVQAFHLDGLAGKVEYAQLLNDASEPACGKMPTPHATLTLEPPVRKPDVVVPVVEPFSRTSTAEGFA